MVEITRQPLHLQPLIDAVSDPGAGAVVTFSGVVRNHSRGEAISHLEYDAYVEMAEKTLRQTGEETARRWPVRVAISHRLGHLAVGEASVMIAVAATHRRDAFEACAYAIDRIKEIVPIWKKEVSTSGEWWVEGGDAVPVGEPR